jgi:hypothetical protein
MAISEEVRQIISILVEEGFESLAGELLTEISLGREVEKLPRPDEETGYSDNIDAVVVRVPIEEGGQFHVAMNFIRMRLVRPVKAFAEAERIASGLSGHGSVRIRFVDPEERTVVKPISEGDMGDASIADQLNDLLDRLPSMIVQPNAGG